MEYYHINKIVDWKAGDSFLFGDTINKFFYELEKEQRLLDDNSFHYSREFLSHVCYENKDKGSSQA